MQQISSDALTKYGMLSDSHQSDMASWRERTSAKMDDCCKDVEQLDAKMREELKAAGIDEPKITPEMMAMSKKDGSPATRLDFEEDDGEEDEVVNGDDSSEAAVQEDSDRVSSARLVLLLN